MPKNYLTNLKKSDCILCVLKSLAVLLTSFYLLAGCASFNTGKLKSMLVGQQNVASIAHNIAENLAQQAYPPLIPRHDQQPVLVTTFVNIDNLAETSNFGRVLQDGIASRFVQLGYTVKEIKLRREINIDRQGGETMLSRDLVHLKTSQKAQAVAVGTYSLTGNIMYLTARLVRPDNANIISSVDYRIELDNAMLAMLGLQLKNESDDLFIEEPKASLVTRLLY